MIVAITGGTGFVGSHVIDQALDAGHTVRALARSPQPAREGVTWIAGALDHAEALAALASGADAVIHVAGVTSALDRAAFAAGNAAGTRAMVAAAAAAGVRRYVQVSSMAARHPELSDYGWSKAEGDKAVMAAALDWTIVRPGAIYGPRERDLLALFRLARADVTLIPTPPAGQRMAVVHGADLARLLLILAARDDQGGTIVEPDDGTPGGWDTRDFTRAIGTAMGTRVIPVPQPAWIIRAAAWAAVRLRGTKAKLTPDRARYFAHLDWTSHAPPPGALWRAEIDTRRGLADTAAWYRANGLL